jgi:hypothetical protein
MVAVIASPRVMLFRSIRPETEPTADFLAALKDALDSEAGDQKSMAAVAFITTRAQ